MNYIKTGPDYVIYIFIASNNTRLNRNSLLLYDGRRAMKLPHCMSCMQLYLYICCGRVFVITGELDRVNNRTRYEKNTIYVERQKHECHQD